MKTLRTADNSIMVGGLISLSIIGTLGGLTAFMTGFSLIGRNAQTQSRNEQELEALTKAKIKEADSKGAISKAYEKNQVGVTTDNFIYMNGTQANVLDLASRTAQQLIDSKHPDNRLVLVDRYRNVIGYFDGKYACNLKNDCRQIVK